MAEVSKLNPTDVMAVRSRVSWGAIAGGAVVALAVYFVLTLLGVAVGLEVATRRDVPLGMGAALWSVITLLVAMFVGGWTASRLAVGESKLEAMLYGVILWGVMFAGMFWLIGVGVRVGFGAMMGMASGVVVVEDERPAADPSQLLGMVAQRYNSELGGKTFVADLKTMGVDEAQAEKIQAQINQRLEKARDSSTPVPARMQQLADDPQVQHAATVALHRTRQATWYSLLGVVVSMLTVITGALAGSGDLPIPMTILGVRKTTAARPRA